MTWNKTHWIALTANQLFGLWVWQSISCSRGENLETSFWFKIWKPLRVKYLSCHAPSTALMKQCLRKANMLAQSAPGCAVWWTDSPFHTQAAPSSLPFSSLLPGSELQPPPTAPYRLWAPSLLFLKSPRISSSPDTLGVSLAPPLGFGASQYCRHMMLVPSRLQKHLPPSSPTSPIPAARPLGLWVHQGRPRFTYKFSDMYFKTFPMRAVCWDRCGRPRKRQRQKQFYLRVSAHTDSVSVAFPGRHIGSTEEDLKSPLPKRLQACREGQLGYYNVNEIRISRNGRKF